MKIVNTYYLPSGRVFVLETVDGYKVECTEMRDVVISSKENEEVRNTFDPRIVWKHLAPIKDKWLLTVSTQKGCAHNCQFCDVATLPFEGNLTKNEILEQIDFLLTYTPDIVNGTNKAKIGFARMGEPSHNSKNVFEAMKMLHPLAVDSNLRINWLPCFNSIFPRYTLDGNTGVDVLNEVLELKENNFGGNLHLQISCNSTDEDTRRELFGGANVLTIEEIVDIVKKKKLTKRTVTLNFIVMKGVPIDIDSLIKMGLTGDKFAVKLIPLNKTIEAEKHGLEALYNYSTYDTLMQYRDRFIKEGIPTVADSIAKCEEAGLCCGQLVQKINAEL